MCADSNRYILYYLYQAATAKDNIRSVAHIYNLSGMGSISYGGAWVKGHARNRTVYARNRTFRMAELCDVISIGSTFGGVMAGNITLYFWTVGTFDTILDLSFWDERFNAWENDDVSDATVAMLASEEKYAVDLLDNALVPASSFLCGIRLYLEFILNLS